MRYNDPVLCRVLVITYLIIHECPRHHCDCYTSETRPTPHFAASICSYGYVYALSEESYMLLPFTDSREVMCGSSAPRLLCTPAPRSLTQFFTRHKISFYFCRSGFINISHPHLICCMFMYSMFGAVVINQFPP